jgi:hypothetical protein
MSREQGPRTAGMQAAANAGSARRAVLGISRFVVGGRTMSREQGPREAGMRAAANADSDRHDSLGITHMVREGAV